MPTLRIGLFGLRGAGKTVALSVLYLVETGEGLEVTVRDEETIRYLRPLAESLQRGKVPTPTMVAEPSRLKWSVRVGETDYDVETIDFAGELLDVVGKPGDAVDEQMMKQLQTQVRDWFTSCDAVLLFIDSTDPGTMRYRDALTQLLDEMSQRPTIRGSFQRVLVVVFTKADQLVETPQQLSNPQEIQRILNGHPLYQVVQRRLKHHPEQIHSAFFLSSALGWQFLSIENPSQRKVMPCQLFAAFRWGVEQAAQIVHGLHAQVLDELNQELERRRHGPYSWIWAIAHAQSLKRMLETTDRDYQLTQGPHAGQFANLQERIHQAQTKELLGILAGAVTLFLLMLGWCWYYFRLHQVAIYEAYAQLGEPEDIEAAAKERLAFYDKNISTRRWDWFWFLQDRRKVADAQAGQDAFLLWGTEDLRLEAAGSDPQRHLNAKNYLATRSAYTPQNLIARIQHVLESTQGAYNAECRTWKEISALPTGNATECERKVEQLREYINRVDSLSRDEARALLQTTSLEWDKQEYAALENVVRNTAVTRYFQNVELAARAYLREGRHTVQMREAVESLIQQIQRIQGSQRYPVRVKSVIIPRGSDLDGDFRGNPNCSVTVTVASERRQTIKVKPATREQDGSFLITFNQVLEPFLLSGGECKAAIITVTTHRTFFADNVASGRVLEETLPLIHLNGPVELTCRNNKPITVYFDCPAARLTPLPPFKKP